MKLGKVIQSTFIAASLAVSVTAHATSDDDFGADVEKLLQAKAKKLFGVIKPLAEPAGVSDYVPREDADADERILLAHGLKAEYVARNVSVLGDMISFWPDDKHYTHLMVCIEQGRSGTTPGGNGGLNAAIQRVDVNTGSVETILHGMSRCDGIRTTAWGTVLATEEASDGHAYEVIEPLTTTGHWVADRSTGDIRDAIDSAAPSTKIVQRQALPTMAWEGLAVLGNGVVIGGDELRPGSGVLDTDGGAIFKFVPDSPRTDDSLITDLADSPLVSGNTYAMAISCQASSSSSFPQYGQGCEIGVGAWVVVNALNARADADANGATGYYRPEDLHRDTSYDGEGMRFCWANTGNEGAGNYGEVLCAVDDTPLPASPSHIVDARTGFEYLGDGADMTTVVANRFIEGDTRFNSVDNLEIQPKSGNVYVIEDHQYGEIFACLQDGEDRDIKSDGCIAIASVVDPLAEPTGFIFDGSGKTAYVIIQHGEQPDSLRDFTTNPVNGATDDLIKITGFGSTKHKKDKGWHW